jgi:hypothetical protein
MSVGSAASAKRNRTGREPDYLFTLIKKWPERVGSSDWRERARKELDPADHEAYLRHAWSREELSPEEFGTIYREWEAYSTARAKTLERQRIVRSIVEGMDGPAALVSIFGVFYGVFWFFNAESFDGWSLAWALYFHLAVMLVWAISLLVRLPSYLRVRRSRRSADVPADEVAAPITYQDDRIDAVEFEGRKYRSNALLKKVIEDSEERVRNERAGHELMSKDTERAFGRIDGVLWVVSSLGLLGLLEMDADFMPLWLSIAVTGLGIVGLFLVSHLRERLRRSHSEYWSPVLRHFDKTGRPIATIHDQLSVPRLP